MQDSTPSNAKELVTCFNLCRGVFGINAQLVQEVIKVGELTQVYGAPDEVVGIRNLRGRIVTVIDLAAHLGIGRVEMGADTRLMIFEHQQEHYGFLVDRVIEAIPLEQDQIEPVPSSLDPALRARLLGVWRQQDELTALLDPNLLFTWRDAE
ncbi:MAG: chemotaxis protein CheW [Lamprobacter sp.]|uniref:chemotaxis protein CheW n=1 Tax=Lamprobacter sp. TaxID=3100796 RepID=UPI002B25C9C9|nr:chemotaxis protein CheW [Lamprobacter sp.]MEA3639092.1 chemotaxis protein CheW [Lamprobacter sp.]